MNIEKARQPNSQQINADDFLPGPKTVTITGATDGTNEQQVFVSVAEFPGRTYRPSKSMLKVLGALWGDETDPWIQRRVTLFRNPEITFGREKPGGIEISHMSHLDGPVEVSVLVKRGQRKTFTIQPLPDVAPARDWPTEITQAGTDLNKLRTLGNAAIAAKTDPTVIARIREAVQTAEAGQE